MSYGRSIIVLLVGLSFVWMGCAGAVSDDPIGSDEAEAYDEEELDESDEGGGIRLPGLDRHVGQFDEAEDGGDGDGSNGGGDGDGDGGDGDGSGGDGDGDGNDGDGDGDSGDGDGSSGGSDGDGDGSGGDGDGSGSDGDDPAGDGTGDGDEGEDGSEGGEGDEDEEGDAGTGDGDEDEEGDEGGEGDDSDTDSDAGGDSDADDEFTCIDGDDEEIFFDVTVDCQMGMGHWKNQVDDWPVDPESCVASICGVSFVEILNMPADPGNAWKILAGHWITAVLNSLAGADMADLQESMDAAEALLLECEVGEDDRPLAIDLAVELDLDGQTCGD